MIEKVITVVAAFFFTIYMSVPVLIKFITLGPSKMLSRKQNGPQPQELNDVKYGEHRYASLKTVKLHYVISGPQKAPLMLMLHGFPEIWYSWRHQITEFNKSYRVVAVDMRGYGESDRPKRIKDYKMDLLIEDIKLLLEALDHRSCILVAHDWGGAVAWAFANQHPEMVAKLVVMNMCPSPLWKGGFMSNIRQFFASGYIFAFFTPFLPELACSLGDCGALDTAFSDDGTGNKLSIMSEKDLECYKYYFRQAGAFQAGINYYRANLWPPGYQQGMNYPMPVKVIWGCKDKFLTLGLLDSLARSVPQVNVTRIDQANHWVQMDRPQEVNKVVWEFLN